MIAALGEHATLLMAAGALVLMLFAAWAIFAARALFAAAMGVAALCACAAIALVTLGYGDAAAALAAFVGAVLPIMLLGGVLLSTRSVKTRRGAAPWLSIAAAIGAAAAIVWAGPGVELGEPISDAAAGPAPLVMIVVVAAAGCAALLGYGERGVLGSREDGDA